MLTSNDYKQLEAKGIARATAEQQLNYFRTGFPFLRIDRPATAGDGIIRLTDSEVDALEKTFAEKSKNVNLLKFVPASGAATRMFKDLFEFAASGKKNAAVSEVFSRLSDFAFWETLKPRLSPQMTETEIAECILRQTGLNYGNLPKGMLLFHSYPDGARTAIEEHLAEGAAYACNLDHKVNLHFTVSPAHQKGFEDLIDSKIKYYEQRFGLRYNITFSQQKSSTDTLAVDMNNNPMRDTDGSLLFRPGGHGALLENLNDQKADIIFIKNIDNVVPDRLRGVTVTYKKALAGLLLSLQERVHRYIRCLRDCSDAAVFEQIIAFVTDELSFRFPATFVDESLEQKRDYLLQTLNRPIRVCGMVKNEGEPGGGPFWVHCADGSMSLQIAESSQINLADPVQKNLAEAATHFNPVDLVCAVRDVDGQHFNLLDFRDPDTGFISSKSKDGVALKAQELPGLWNGAMARWLTVFVEVPVATFNPVKTLNDLLRKEHQG